MTTGKTIALTRWTFVSKVMSLLFRVRVCHSFSSKEQASFNFIAAITILSDFGAQENKVCHCFHFSPFYLPCHSSTLTWKIPWMEEPGGLQSMRSLRVWHDWATSLSLFTFMHWRRKWQSTPVFLPGESQGQRSLVGGRLWGRTESDMTEAT